MPIVGFFPGGGTNTKDATATADDVLLGKTAYGADGKMTGTLRVKEATGSITVAANATVTIPLDFAPLAAVTYRTDSVSRFINSFMVYAGLNKNNTVANVFDTSYQGYFAEFKPDGNAITITARSYPATATYTWYACGL